MPIPISACRDPEKYTICPHILCHDEHEPVCGSDGQMYENICKLVLKNCENDAAGHDLIYVDYEWADCDHTDAEHGHQPDTSNDYCQLCPSLS